MRSCRAKRRRKSLPKRCCGHCRCGHPNPYGAAWYILAEAKRTVRCRLGDRAYDILIGPGLIKAAGREISARMKGKKVAVITDDNVGALYLEPFMESLAADGISATSLTLPAGEKTKSFDHLITVCDAVLAPGSSATMRSLRLAAALSAI